MVDVINDELFILFSGGAPVGAGGDTIDGVLPQWLLCEIAVLNVEIDLREQPFVMDGRNKASKDWIGVFHPSLKHGFKFVDGHRSQSHHFLFLQTLLFFLKFLPKKRADLVYTRGVYLLSFEKVWAII